MRPALFQSNTSDNRFIQLYNQLDEHLAQIMDEDSRTPFYSLVERAAQRRFIVKRDEATLKKYGSLRNLIVHDADYPKHVLAEPTEENLAQFGRIVQRLMHPQTLNDFRREVRTFSERDTLASALAHMRSGDFSQVVVRDDHLALLTTEGVTKWLERQQNAASLADATIGDALTHEPPGSFELVSRRETLEQAQATFIGALERGKPRLYALIITENGKPHETPLGVVTPWDVIEND